MNTQKGAQDKSILVSQDGSVGSAWHHECELSGEVDAEADLHLHYNHCPKNPGHKNFIPIGQFNIEHLPDGCRDEDIVEWTKLTAALTVKVCVRYTSVDRPETCPDTDEGKLVPAYEDKVGGGYPFSGCKGKDVLRTGTAWVFLVYRYKGQCECKVNCPYKDGGKVPLLTARHVVYDKSEAEKSELIFHYDSEVDQGKIRVERGREVGYCSTETDVSVIHCWSHDGKFLDSLEETLKRRQVLKEKLYNKYNSYIKPTLDIISGFNFQPDTPHPHFPVVIISHPHGRAKMVTVGEVLEVLEGDDKHRMRHVYKYTADTCPGSSGALACCVHWRWWSRLDSEWKVGLVPTAPHSQALEVGVKCSAAAWLW